jgi:hypothetical protein
MQYSTTSNSAKLAAMNAADEAAGVLLLRERIGGDLTERFLGATKGGPEMIQSQNADLQFEIRIFTAVSGGGMCLDIIPMETLNPLLPAVVTGRPPKFLTSPRQAKTVLQLASSLHRQRWHIPTDGEWNFITAGKELSDFDRLLWHVVGDVFAPPIGDNPVAFYGKNAGYDEATGMVETYWTPMKRGPHGLVPANNGIHAGDSERAQGMHGLYYDILASSQGVRAWIPWALKVEANGHTEAAVRTDRGRSPLFYFAGVIGTLFLGHAEAQDEYVEMLPAAQEKRVIEKVVRRAVKGGKPLSETDESWEPGTYEICYGAGLRPQTVVLDPASKSAEFVLRTLTQAADAGEPVTVSKVG